jgi:predicted nucleic acid-binding protein
LTRTTAFWDTSVIIPLCVHEDDSHKIRALQDKYSLVVWWATAVEAHSAFARKRRGGLGRQEADQAVDRLHLLREEWQEIRPSQNVLGHAQRLLYLYPLRAADSLQLAAALIWCRNRPAGRTFLCADTRLAEAANQAGFSVLRP